jgi:hypothetical protein
MTTLQKSVRMFIAMLALVGIIVLFLAGPPILDRLGFFSETVATAWSIGFALAVSAGLIGYFWYVARLFNSRAYRQVRAQGIPITAQVLDIQPTGARMRKSRTMTTITPSRPAREFLLRLLVSRPGAAPYEATVVGIIEFAKVPNKGDTIAVKVHPQRPAVVVLAEEATP